MKYTNFNFLATNYYRSYVLHTKYYYLFVIVELALQKGEKYEEDGDSKNEIDDMRALQDIFDP